MPALREATAPKISPIAVVITSAATRATVGSQPRWSPFEVPPGPPCVARLPRTIPAMPASAVWESDTMPPYAERKIRLAAASPKKNVESSIWCVQYVLTRPAGARIAKRSASAASARSVRCRSVQVAGFTRVRRGRGPEREHEGDQDEREDRRVLGAAVGAGRRQIR